MAGASDKFLSGNRSTDESNIRNSIGRYRGQTQRAFGLQFRFCDGRNSQGFAWAWYLGNQWTRRDADEELVLLFTHYSITITGWDLDIIIYALEEQDMKWLQELGTAECQQRAELNRTSDAEKKQPAISKIAIFPTIKEAAERLKEPTE